MKKGLIIFTFIFLFVPSIASACTKAEINRLNTIAKNVDITYDYYYDENNNVRFTITLTNLHDNIKIYDVFNNKYIFSNNTKEITMNNFLPGVSYKFNIYGNTSSCKDEFVLTLYKTTPGYNSYSTDELCKGIEEFELCQKGRTAPITYDKFKELVLKYKKEKEPNIITDDEDTKDFQYYLGLVISFVLRYNVYYISALIGIFILILILKQKDNFKIE